MRLLTLSWLQTRYVVYKVECLLCNIIKARNALLPSVESVRYLWRFTKDNHTLKVLDIERFRLSPVLMATSPASRPHNGRFGYAVTLV
jgi:hypothetical protein